jgi:hypothetical protein
MPADHAEGKPEKSHDAGSTTMRQTFCPFFFFFPLRGLRDLRANLFRLRKKILLEGEKMPADHAEKAERKLKTESRTEERRKRLEMRSYFCFLLSQFLFLFCVICGQIGIS